MIDRDKLRKQAEQHLREAPTVIVQAQMLVELLNQLESLEHRLALSEEKIQTLLGELKTRSYNYAWFG
jgi:predicted nucleic acid-binding protein